MNKTGFSSRKITVTLTDLLPAGSLPPEVGVRHPGWTETKHFSNLSLRLPASEEEHTHIHTLKPTNISMSICCGHELSWSVTYSNSSKKKMWNKFCMWTNINLCLKHTLTVCSGFVFIYSIKLTLLASCVIALGPSSVWIGIISSAASLTFTDKY